MKKSLMVSVAAAALLAATGLAAAQGTGTKGAESAPVATSPKGESSPSAAPSMSKESAAPSATKSSAAPEMKDSAAPKSAQDNSATKAMPKQAQDKAGGAMTDSKSKASESTAPSGSAKPATADSKTGADTKSKASESTAPSGAAKPATADSKTGADTKSATTGNAATSATAAPPAEKQPQIAAAFKQEKVQETTNVNFNISVGTAVPASVHFYPLPPRIVEIYPEWRGYDFIVVHGRYVILRPQTHEIIYIIEG